MSASEVEVSLGKMIDVSLLPTAGDARRDGLCRLHRWQGDELRQSMATFEFSGMSCPSGQPHLRLGQNR
ncbi:hypothetical protein [Rhizobium tubonense]|uniref:Uncharacterized protein n=1 Tax=Rhizobium tubonense TaxID=484088 RepID=A0A2W4DGX4_9HYPH|nr:hypothetical protein [Rhizobium tubonense]PZM15704.1 hypothetical protein CPY51_05910 [Rhizobium tubonense]